jgi:hypothetical protein
MKRVKTIEFLLASLPSGCDTGKAFEQAARFCPVEVVAAMLKRGARCTDDALDLAAQVGIILPGQRWPLCAMNAVLMIQSSN